MRSILLLLLLSLPLFLSAQGLAGERNADRGLLINISYGPIFPAGDLSSRFGRGYALGGGLDYLLKGKNLQIGFMGQFGFGNTVKEDVVANLRANAGFVIGNQRSPADIQLRQRQLFLAPRIGYTFPLGGENSRAGIKVTTAVGYLAHWIRVQPDAVQEVIQVEGDRRAGYDRLTGGPAVYQFLGYQQLALNRRLNFYLGGELTAGFTKSRRAFDVTNARPADQSGRTDLVLGVRAGFILPLYFGEGREIFY